jgi:hypothetical protein
MSARPSRLPPRRASAADSHLAQARRTVSAGRPPGPPARATRRSPDDAQVQATPRYLEARREGLASYADIASLADSREAASMAQPRRDEDLAATLPSRPRADLAAEIEPAAMPQLEGDLEGTVDAPASGEAEDGAATPTAEGGSGGDAPPAAGPAAGGQGEGPATRQRRRGGDEEEEEGEASLSQTPVAEPSTAPVMLMRRPLDLRGIDAPLVMPRYLAVEPAGGKSAVPAPARGYENAFGAVAASAERLHRGFVQDGRDAAAALVSLYRQMEDGSQQTLDTSLFELARVLASGRLDLATAEADAIARLELQAQTARILIRGAARRSLGTVSARKAAIEQRIALARAGAADVESDLAFYAGEVDRTGPPASQAFSSLNADPSPAHVPDAAAEFGECSAQMAAAENEPLDPAVQHRASDRSTAFTQATTIFASQLATAATGFQSAATEAFQPFQNYITQLGTSAPRQIATMRRNALKQVDKTVRNGIETVRRSRNQVEQSMVERYRRSREQIVATADRAGQAQQAGLARAGEGQLQAYRAMAAAQGGTVTALHEEIARQRGQTAEQFAVFARQASQRTDERAGNVARSRRQSMAEGAERMRRQTKARGDSGLAAQSHSAENLAEQLAALARQSGLSLMAQILGLEAGLRRLAEPLASVIDNFPIPAEAVLQTMEDTLWEKLNTARDQAHAAYFGGTPPASEETTTGNQTVTSPPTGTGTNPSEFVDKATALAAAPATEEQIVSVTQIIANGVVGDVTRRGDGLMGQMTLLGQNPGETLALVRGLTYLRGQAVICYYNCARPGNLWDDIAFYMSFGNPVTGFDTRVYSGEAVYNYLLGNRAAGALLEIQAATEWWNNGDQVQEAMTALSPADVEALRGLPGAGEVLDAVESDLDGADQKMFHILRNVTEANAAESVAAVRAVRLDVQIEEALATDPERGADNAFDIMESSALAGASTRLEGANEFGLTADYQVETPEQAEARRNRSWQETVARLGNEGERRADGAAGGVEYLRQLVSRERLYQSGDVYYEASARPEQVLLLTNLAAHGPGAPETRAAQLMVEETRRGGGKPERVEHALHDPELNADMANPDRPPPEDGQPEETPEALRRAREREEQMFLLYDQYRNPNRQGPPRTVTEIRADLGARLRAGQTDERQGRLMERQVVHGLTDPETAALAFEHSVDRAGTDEDLLRRQFGRMSRDQIDEAVRRYDDTHTPGLYERLGIFDHSDGYFRELSGDDRLEIQVLAMGQPRNDRERGEVARMTSRLQLDNASGVGKLLAGEEHRRLQRSHDRLTQLMGVGSDETAFDSRGRLTVRGPNGERLEVGRFNAEGGFQASSGQEATAFTVLMATNQRNAEAYKQATDNIANAVTTTLVVAAAVISTIATGGAAASIWIPVLVTAGAGIVGMAANLAIKGGRYGYEDAGRDFGMTIVQAATAGIGAGLGIARAGGSTAFRAAMGARMISNQGFRALSLFDEALIAGASGAIGGGGNALFDDKSWDRGEWLANIGHGMRKGFLGGFAGGVVTGGATRAISGLAQGVGRAGGALTAFSRGRGADVGSRLGRLRGDAYSRAFPTTLAGRTVGGGLGGAATKYVEIDYDRRRGAYTGSRAQAFEEIANEGIQNSFQSFLEGVGEHASDNSPRMKAWRESILSGKPPPPPPPPPHSPPAHDPDGPPPPHFPPGPGSDRPPPGRPPGGAPESVPGPAGRAGVDGPDPRGARLGRDDDEGAILVAANDDSDPVVARSLVDSDEPAAPAIIPPKPVRMALTPHNMLAMGSIPEASVFIHPNSRSFEAANDNYRMLTQADPSREAAIYRNADTGEYLVIQGREGHVTTIDQHGNLQIRGVKEGVPLARGPHAPEPGGRWIMEHHYHPTRPGDAPGAYLARFPSGTNGDIRVIVREADKLGFESRTGRIDFIDNGRTNYSLFSYDARTRVVTIDFPDPITGARVIQKFANPEAYDAHIVTLKARAAELRAGTPALGRDSVGTRLTEGDAFSARRLGESAMSGEAHRQALTALQANGASPETMAAFRAEADAAASATRSVAHDLGLVGQPDSMARLHLIMNDTSLAAPMRQAIADTVLAATREHMIAAGQLRPDEPLMLLFHGAPVARASSLHSGGAQISRVAGGAQDDFGRGLYLTSRVEAADIYAAKFGQQRGEIFPFVLRGRDLGTVVDVSPGGAHRAEWEAFVMRNTHRFDRAMAIGGATIDFPALVAGRQPFGTMDAFGNRGTVFEAFLAHLAAKTGDPRLGAPDVVLGELGGPMTSGVGGRGDQQAIRSQAVMDEMNRQIGFGLRRSGPQGEGGGEGAPPRARQTAEESSDVIEARSLTLDDQTPTPKLPPADPSPPGVTPAHQDQALALLEQHDLGGEAVATIRALAQFDRDGVMAVLHAETPEATRAALTRLRERLVANGTPERQAAMLVGRLDYANGVLGPRFRIEAAHRAALAMGGYADDPSLSPAVNRWLNESAVLRFLYTADRGLFDSMIRTFRNGRGKGGKFRVERFEAFVLEKVRNKLRAVAPLLHYHLELSDRYEAMARMTSDHLDPASWPTVVRQPIPPEAIGPVVTDAAQVPAGLRVDHESGRRGTVMKVENGVAHVHFDGDPDGQLHPIAIADGGLHHSHDPNPEFGDPPPIRDESYRAQRYAEIDAHRQLAGYGPYTRNGGNTVAMVQLNGETFHGTNSTLDPGNYALPIEARRRLVERLRAEFGLVAKHTGEAEFVSHAEAEALLRAYAHFGELPEVVEIYVDRATCQHSCQIDLPRIARMLGVKELRIYQMAGSTNPIIMR